MYCENGKSKNSIRKLGHVSFDTPLSQQNKKIWNFLSFFSSNIIILCASIQNELNKVGKIELFAVRSSFFVCLKKLLFAVKMRYDLYNSDRVNVYERTKSVSPMCDSQNLRTNA